MAKENENLLEEVYKAAQMGFEASEQILPKVQDVSLRQQIDDQRKNYKGMSLKARALLRENGESPQKEKLYQKAMLKGAVQMKTMTDCTASHIAELMINGTTTGIIDMTKKLNRLDHADEEAKRLAEDYLENEKKNIENLKSYLC
jgi:hypothetical protein